MTTPRYERGVISAEDYTSSVKHGEGKRCSLKSHYRYGSIARQVVSVIEFLSQNNDQKFVYASVEQLRKMCWHYKDGKRDKNPSLREIKYVLAMLRKQGIISPRVKLPVWWRFRGRNRDWQGGKKLWGFVVVDHDSIAVRDYGGDDERCTLLVEKTLWVAIPDAVWKVQPNAIFVAP